ncbi:hypothetical protein CC78DRAFT_113884 [Lojkania enalia]|uniref:tRNA(Phe) (4-demethylwyosine(37)-C(7)) aminocarboxypropyltransferase n=1 Tax=Lojkania enalia TaxID=147567 RepID=A0A9P4JWZ2_9PLEO|nr:hypothetical protein CC78DRAFT_113884 [Didymosphaeria enalia]
MKVYERIAIEIADIIVRVAEKVRPFRVDKVSNSPHMKDYRLCILAPRIHVKGLKTALEKYNLLDKSIKITPEKCIPEEEKEEVDGPKEQSRMIIPTTERASLKEGDDLLDFVRLDRQKKRLLEKIGLHDLIQNDRISVINLQERTAGTTPRNPVMKALRDSLCALPDTLLDSLDLTVEELLTSFPTTYTIYPPMLLLPIHALNSPPWKKLLSKHDVQSPALQSVWKCLATTVGQTNVALNAGIPFKQDFRDSSLDSISENFLRSPVDLRPLYGNFGPPPTPDRVAQPTQQDFLDAFWVTTMQNGIYQTWAPQYTMFSRGNIKEKARLLTLPSVLSSVSEGNGQIEFNGLKHPSSKFRTGSTAVDLYAGIGYFAFSYKKAGIDKVLCWELNPWSIEGLRRGAALNGWSSQIFTIFPRSDEEWQEWRESVKDVDFLIFQQSNEDALAAICQLARNTGSGNVQVPTIRHVNCGFLPSSKESWEIAIRIIDTQLGGWIHAHENIGVQDIDQRKEEVTSELNEMLNRWRGEMGACGSYRFWVKCEHVEKVKTYAPGVMHVVFDLHINWFKDAEFLL